MSADGELTHAEAAERQEQRDALQRLAEMAEPPNIPLGDWGPRLLLKWCDNCGAVLTHQDDSTCGFCHGPFKPIWQAPARQDPNESVP